MEAESPTGSGEVSEFHPWDPHKAAKDVEVGDFYFKRKNYVGAESRYREALLYKDNDAIATFHLAVCLEKMNRPDEARQEYESYLKILPYGPQAEDAKKAIARLTSPAADAKPAK
jgi:tetratricopeptide (TPR) repeat protein